MAVNLPDYSGDEVEIVCTAGDPGAYARLRDQILSAFEIPPLRRQPRHWTIDKGNGVKEDEYRQTVRCVKCGRLSWFEIG